MKTFFASILVLIAFAVPAFAVGSGGTAFPIYSTAAAGVKTSAAYDVRGYKTKTLTVSGVRLTSNSTNTIFNNMSGTAIVQCAPTTNGPWSTCIANGYAQTAVSLTANNQITWSDAVAYIRFKWTATSGSLGAKLKAYLNWIEN